MIILISAMATCDTNGCSDLCALVDGIPQCFCPVGFELPHMTSLTCEGIKTISVLRI